MKLFPRFFLRTLGCAVLAMAGCGERVVLPEGAPEPGTMRVVSIEPLQRSVDTGNLLANGNFAEWWAGAPTPNGFLPPEDGGMKFARVPGETGNFLLRQSWTRLIEALPLNEKFRTEIGEVEEGQPYVLEVTATVSLGRTVSLSLWQEGDEGWELAEHAFLVVLPSAGAVKTYRKAFIPEWTGGLFVAADGHGETGEDVHADWFSWHLQPARST